jgi:hypothetical protein
LERGKLVTATPQESGEGALPMGSGTCPATIERGKPITVAVVWKAPLEMGGKACPHETVNTEFTWLEKAGVAPPPPVCLETGRLPTAAKVWHAPLESREGAPTHTNSK